MFYYSRFRILRMKQWNNRARIFHQAAKHYAKLNNRHKVLKYFNLTRKSITKTNEEMNNVLKIWKSSMPKDQFEYHLAKLNSIGSTQKNKYSKIDPVGSILSFF